MPKRFVAAITLLSYAVVGVTPVAAVASSTAPLPSVTVFAEPSSASAIHTTEATDSRAPAAFPEPLPLWVIWLLGVLGGILAGAVVYIFTGDRLDMNEAIEDFTAACVEAGGLPNITISGRDAEMTCVPNATH